MSYLLPLMFSPPTSERRVLLDAGGNVWTHADDHVQPSRLQRLAEDSGEP